MGTELLDALAGVGEPDLVVVDGRVVDVHGKRVRDGGIAVKAGRIIRVGEVEAMIGADTEVIDARGRYLTPGLIESHAHSYHANLNLTEYAKLCLRRGTTAVAESFYGQGQIRGKDAVASSTTNCGGPRSPCSSSCRCSPTCRTSSWASTRRRAR
jgi:adenine deaminase